MLVCWYSHKDEQVSQPASLGLFSRVEVSEHYEKIFFKFLRRFLSKEIDGESSNKAHSCLLDILALIQDIGKIEDTTYCIIAQCGASIVQIPAFEDSFPLRGGAQKVHSSLFTRWEVIGQSNERLQADRYYFGNLYIVIWLTSLPFYLTLTEHIKMFMEMDGVGQTPGFFWHHRCLPDNMTCMFKVRVLVRNQLTLASGAC